MSEHQPFHKSQATKPSASGPGDRIANPRDIATYFREDCRTLGDSLQLEMVVAQYDLRLRGVASPEGVPVGDAAVAGVVTALQRHGDDLSHAILRGVAHLGTGTAASRGEAAAAHLAEQGVGLPPNFTDVGAARALGAWTDARDADPGEFALFADFEHPDGGRRHSLALYVEPRHGGTIKHIGLMPPVSSLRPGDPFHPSALAPVELAEAGELLAALVRRTYGDELELADDYRALVAAARARALREPAAAMAG